MAYDKIVDSAALDVAMTATADAIRAKTGSSDKIEWTEQGFAAAVEGISGGGSGGEAVPWNDVSFVDYDGTVLYSYTTAEAKALSELPPLPSQPGLICQGWNYDLETIKSYDTPVTVGATYITDDGTTRIYISLYDGRTSPMLGCCPNGTVTVDWGDGTEPDVLTGTSVTSVKWTPTHNYAAAGDYVIRLSVDGEVGFKGDGTYGSHLLRYNSGYDKRQFAYVNSIGKIEIGTNVALVDGAFYSCYSLENITIPTGQLSLGKSAFAECYSLSKVVLPKALTSVGEFSFNKCYSLTAVYLPDKSVSSIDQAAFQNCASFSGIVMPKSVNSLKSSAFTGCASAKFYDFSLHEAVPSLAATSVFNGIAADCEIRVPAALYDEWIAATNWSSYASYIVAV